MSETNYFHTDQFQLEGSAFKIQGKKSLKVLKKCGRIFLKQD